MIIDYESKEFSEKHTYCCVVCGKMYLITWGMCIGCAKEAGNAAVNNIHRYKELYNELCEQVAEMCKYLGATDDMMLDSWTLLNLIIETKKKADKYDLEIVSR